MRRAPLGIVSASAILAAIEASGIPDIDTSPRSAGRPIAPCGTRGAQRRHRRLGEDCAVCWKVGRRDGRADEHGTRGGYERHRRLGEATCTPCRDANRARAQRQRQRSADESTAVAA